MRIDKCVLAPLEEVYAVSSLADGPLRCPLAATEGHGGALLFQPPGWEPRALWEGPGGVMCLEQLPGRRALVAIERFFPVFRAREAGVVCAVPEGQPGSPWRVRRVQHLPFVHRLKAVRAAGRPVLLAATVCGTKKHRDDWSRPGALYAAEIPAELSAPWSFHPIVQGLHKNHGLTAARMQGRDCLLLSCQEGLLRVWIPDRTGERWQTEALLEREVSDAAVYDLDGDGRQELAVIEPFHGNRLAVYRPQGTRWREAASWELDFGHVAWCGPVLGRPALIAGSRSGRQELTLYLGGVEVRRMQSLELDSAVEPTQVEVFQHGGQTVVISANHGPGEVAAYRIAP